jgi:hypothetical protein
MWHITSIRLTIGNHFDDGRNTAMSPSQLRTAVEQKCPDAAEFSFEHSVVYHLEP